MLSKVLSLISLTQIDAILVDKQCVSPVKMSSQQLSLEEKVNFSAELSMKPFVYSSLAMVRGIVTIQCPFHCYLTIF